MGCAWKYGQSFLVATRRANSTCSRWLYWISASTLGLVEEKYWPLLSILIETSETTKYTKSVSPASGLARTGGSTRYCLIDVGALSHSSFHSA